LNTRLVVSASSEKHLGGIKVAIEPSSVERRALRGSTPTLSQSAISRVSKIHNQWLVINQKAISQKNKGNQPDYQSNFTQAISREVSTLRLAPYFAHHGHSSFFYLSCPIIFSSRINGSLHRIKTPSMVNPE
jgi:hypothetical protein